MRSKRWMFLVALLAAFSLVAAACGGNGNGNGGGTGTDGETEKTDVTVYFQGALSGPYNYLVIPAFQGAQLRIDELNEDENFPYNITLERADTQGDPEQAPPVVEDVVSDPNTVAVIGPGFSGESSASGDTYNESQIPFVTPSATAVSLAQEKWDYWYRGVGNDGGQGGFAGAYIAQQLKPASLFVAHDKSDYGQPLAETVRDTAQQGGVKIAGFEGAEAGQEDYSALISAVEGSGAEALFFGGYDADFAKIVKQARDAGLDIPMMSGDGSLSSTFLELAGKAADNVVLIAPTNISGDFVQKYSQEYGGKASSVPVYAAEGYDVASLIGEGLSAGGEGLSPEEARQAIKEYLDGLSEQPFQGVAKEYAFAENHELQALEEAPEDLFYLYEVKGGELSPLGSAADLGLTVEG